MKDSFRNSPQSEPNAAEHGTVSPNEGGGFAGLTRLKTALGLAAAMAAAVPTEARANQTIEPGETATCNAKGERITAKDCAPKKGKGKRDPKPDPTPPPAEDVPTQMNLRTPNISDATYYTVLDGAKIPKGSPIDYIQFNKLDDSATVYVHGQVDLCLDAIGKVGVDKNGNKYNVDSNDWAMSVSVKQDLGSPAAQTVDADAIRKQPVNQASVRVRNNVGGTQSLTGWTTTMRLDPQDAIPVGKDDIRIIKLQPQAVEGANLALPMIVRLDACDEGVDLRHVQTPKNVAAYQLPVNPYFAKLNDFSMHGMLRPTADPKFKSGYKAFAQATNGIVNLPAGTHLDARRVGRGVVDSFGRPVPDHYVRVTAQYGAPNNEPEGLVLMNGANNNSPEISQLSGVHATAWSFQTEMFDPNTCTDTGCTFNFKRAFWPEDHSTGVTRDITATVTFDGGELVRTFDQQPRFVGTKTPTIGSVEVDRSEYNVDPFLVCRGIANTIMCFTQQGAGDQTKYQVCGAGVAPEDNGKTRMFHLHCGEDMLNQPAPRMLGARN